MSACPAVGVLQIGGRSVMELPCALQDGHGLFGIPHEVTLSWSDDAVLDFPDLDLLDLDEPMTDVPLVEPDPDAEG